MEKMGSQDHNNSKLLRKPIRRRSYTRKFVKQPKINMAEARREIAHALQLHRSTNSLSPSTTSTKTTVASQKECCSHKMPAVSSSYFCNYSLVEAMPLPEPVWSTTAPSVLPAASSGLMELPGREVNQGCSSATTTSSSCTWWLAFLQGLDDNTNKDSEKFLQENFKLDEEEDLTSSVLRDNVEMNATLDEWLMFPTVQDDHL